MGEVTRTGGVALSLADEGSSGRREACCCAVWSRGQQLEGGPGNTHLAQEPQQLPGS